MALRKRALIAAISADAEIRHLYINSQGQTCAIGGLARVAGVSDDDLRTMGGSGIGIKRTSRTFDTLRRVTVYRVRRIIARRFGLTIAQMESIQAKNDSSFDLTERRERINDYITSLK